MKADIVKVEAHQEFDMFNEIMVRTKDQQIEAQRKDLL